MRWAASFLPWLCGCAQLFGLDETNGDGRLPVSLQFERVSIGATIQRSPLDLTSNTATYLVPDDVAPSGLTRVPATQSGIDTWTADIFDATPPIEFDLPDFPAPIQRLWDYPNKTLLGGFNVFEHPDPQPAPPGAMLTVNVTLDVPTVGNEGFQLFTIGSWNIIGLPAPVLGSLAEAPPAFAMTTMQSFTGRPHEAITTADSVLVLRYVANDLTGALEVAPFDQTGNDQITGAINAVTHDRMVDVKIDQTKIATRYSAARPAVPTVSVGWGIRASPGFEVGDNNGPLLQATAILPTDTMIQVPYGNPFDAKGWKSTLTWSTNASRVFTPAGQTLPVTLFAGMFQFATDPTAGLVLDLPAGLPELISFDGMPLSSDGTPIAAPTHAVEVTFITDRPTNTLYQLQLFELVPNAAATALEFHQKLGASGSQPKFTLPPELFEPGKIYTLRAVSVQGSFPNIATGDLRARDTPLAISFLDSAVIQVNP
jgi:hypothetical protein